MKTKYFIPLIATTVLSIALFFSFSVLGNKLKNLRESGIITVKGVSESLHKSTICQWYISIKAQGKTYSEALENIKRDEKKMLVFLRNLNFSNSEIQKERISVDKIYDEYHDEKLKRWISVEKGFEGEVNFTINTKKLQTVDEAYNKMQEMKASGLSIRFEKPLYYLENLENIKRKLISQATQDAKLRAEEFAKNNHAKVGSIKSASQGTFEILPYSNSESNLGESYGGYYDTSSIEKIARLVVTIQYNIEN